MKKLLILLCVIALCFVSFVACNDGTGETEGIATPAGTADTANTAGNNGQTSTTTSTASAATPSPTKESTPTPSPTPAPSYDPNVYTFEMDVTIITANVGFLLAGYDNGNFVMLQLAIGEKDDGYLYYRPHQWVGGSAETIAEVQVDPEVASGEYNTTYHVKLEMNNHMMTVSINGTKIDETEVEDGTYGMIGFRTALCKLVDANEAGTFDNFVLTNSEGVVVWTEDFEGETNYFSDAIEYGDLDAYVKDGKLVVGTGSTVLFLDDGPSLKAPAES